jgi:hypothetical protein
MPKIEIDYSNTIFYKITCNDKTITDVYVGHTTNFVQRKHAHKQNCKNKNSANHKCKLYKVMRHNGGWENWNMEIINFLNCANLYEARKKEQEYFIELNATLNSIEPLPKSNTNQKPIKIKKEENIIMKIEEEIKKKQRFICKECNIFCNNKKTYEDHIKTNKHKKYIINNNNKKEEKEKEKPVFFVKPYTCENCDFQCSKKSNYDAHLLTRKHKRRGKPLQKTEEKKYICVCGKKYNHRQGLFVHKKKCEEDDNKQDINSFEALHLTNLVIELINNNKELQKQNQAFQSEILVFQKHNHEIQKQMVDVCKNTKTTNIHSNNKTFNMQVFLNEQCKDAMNIMDFVNSMTLELSDLEDVGELGYVEGISKIIIRKLNELDVCKRPIHCSDFKREIMYVRDMDVWSKENSTFDKIRKAIKYVTKKNSDLLIPWIQKYPSGMNIEHPHNDIYMRLMNQAMGGRESFLDSENKIIKKISKAVQIDKSYMKSQ